MFGTYLKLGFEHILDLNGYDHILFVIVLCAYYGIVDWKKILILVTAFTIGHSVTLAMAALGVIKVNADLVEFLIPVTIFVTAILNMLIPPNPNQKLRPNYFLALFFGFIHGMGFSNFFRSLLGQEADVVMPLLAFNIGVEVGQLCIVALILLLNFLIVKKAGLEQRKWNWIISLLGAGVSLYMIIEKINP